jgi:hypothetical protein
MKHAVGILSIAMVPVFAAGLALGEDRYGGSGSEPRGTGAGAATSGTPGTVGGFMGQHMMTGTVTDIDADEGKITVEAEGHELDLHFPRTALQGLKKGDRVTVQLAIRQAGAAGATSGTGGTGTGTGIDTDAGTRTGPGGGPGTGTGYPGGAGSGPSTR